MSREKSSRQGGKIFAGPAAAAVLFFLIFLLLFQRFHAAGIPRAPLETASAGKGKERVILLLADRLAYGDLRAAAGPKLAQLLEKGAVALMNVRTGRPGSESGYLSLGAGSRAAAGPEGGAAFERGELFEGERAEIIFERCNGSAARGALVHLHVAALREKNEILSYPVTVGLLGEMLKEKGLAAAVWGNADGAAPNRSAVMIAMDSGGTVQAGAVGEELLQKARLYPYGRRTDAVALAAAVADNFEAAELHVVEFGDSSRLDEYWPCLAPERGAELFRMTMQNLDSLLGELQPLLRKENCILILASPSLPLNRPAGGEQFTPLLLASAAGGGPGPGLLISAATRRPGLVQNSDLPGLILHLLAGAAEETLSGQAAPFALVRDQDPLAFLERFSIRTALVYSQRTPLLKGYVALLVAALLVGLASLLLKLRPLLGPLSELLRFLLFIPPAFLLLPGLISFPRPVLWQSTLFLAGAALLPFLLLHPLQRRSPRLYLAVLGWVTALTLVADTSLGAPLQQLSMLSYDPAGGARYYGVGNEYMGVLIGAALLGTVSLAAYINGRGAAAGRRKGPFILPAVVPALFYGIIIFILAAPNLGANLGGTLTAAVAFGAALAELTGAGAGKMRTALSITAFLLLAALSLWILNGRLLQLQPSHVGLFGEMVRSRGLAGFRETALRKLSLNVKLVRYSIWGRALVTLVGLCAVLSLYPGGLRQRLHRERPYLVAGVTAALAGAAAALLTNDSGVVAAATLLLYAVPPALTRLMQENLAPGKDIKSGGQD